MGHHKARHDARSHWRALAVGARQARLFIPRELENLSPSRKTFLRRWPWPLQIGDDLRKPNTQRIAVADVRRLVSLDGLQRVHVESGDQCVG